MFNILSYEISLLSGVDQTSVILLSQALGLTLQQIKDFLLVNSRLPTSEDVQQIFKMKTLT